MPDNRFGDKSETPTPRGQGGSGGVKVVRGVDGRIIPDPDDETQSAFTNVHEVS